MEAAKDGFDKWYTEGNDGDIEDYLYTLTGKELPKDFNKSPYFGYSDHSVGIDIPLMAISRGAKVIEKHFTLDKSDTTIRDHALSATPEEFFQMIKIGTQIRKNLNIGV